MMRGLRSVRRVPCVYPVLSVVWLLPPSIFLTPSISASAPSNTGFFFSKICASQDRDERDANAMHIFRAVLSVSSLSPAPCLSIHTSCPFTPARRFFHRVLFSILAGFDGYLAPLCFCYCYCFRFPFFFSFGGVLASRDARVLEPLRDTSVISKLGLGHSLPARGSRILGRGGESGFSIYSFSAVVRLVLLLIGICFFKPSFVFIFLRVGERSERGPGGPG
jgi:hypothetical protein